MTTQRKRHPTVRTRRVLDVTPQEPSRGACDTPWWIQFMTCDELGLSGPKYIVDQSSGAIGISYRGGAVRWLFASPDQRSNA